MIAIATNQGKTRWMIIDALQLRRIEFLEALIKDTAKASGNTFFVSLLRYFYNLCSCLKTELSIRPAGSYTDNEGRGMQHFDLRLRVCESSMGGLVDFASRLQRDMLSNEGRRRLFALQLHQLS